MPMAGSCTRTARLTGPRPARDASISPWGPTPKPDLRQLAQHAVRKRTRPTSVGGLRTQHVSRQRGEMDDHQANGLANSFAIWALGQMSFRAVAVVGSWARGTARPDSDLDLVALVDDLRPWASSDAWLRALACDFGFSVTAAHLERYGVARSWRIHLAPDVELELTLAPLGWALANPMDEGTRRVVNDGMTVLVDKDGLLGFLQAAAMDIR